MKVRSGKFQATIGPELMDMVRRVGDGAVGRVFDALEEHGDILVSDARARWPVYTGASRDGLRSETVIFSDKIVLRVLNEATKADQTARLRGMLPPEGKSRGHFVTWAAAQNKPKSTSEPYGYMIGGRPSTWKELVLDPAKRAEPELIERIAEDVRKLAEGE